MFAVKMEMKHHDKYIIEMLQYHPILSFSVLQPAALSYSICQTH